MLKMLIMGPAGAGKGTMSELICDNFNVQHVSTGDMFREELKQNTELGQKANEYMSKGLLVPDEVTIQMVNKRIRKEDCANGYLLDGFPRSLPQAEAIENLGINVVINLTVGEDKLVERIVNRRLCRNCGRIYNITTLPSKVEGVCDDCGGELYQRGDDTYEKLMVRLDSYTKQTEPVVEYYRAKNVVYDIDAGKPINEVFDEIKKILTKVMEDSNN